MTDTPWSPFELTSFDPTDTLTMWETPWRRTEWSANFVTINEYGAAYESRDDPTDSAALVLDDVRPKDASPFDDACAAMVDRVIALGAGGDFVDLAAGIARLKDGRYVAWESLIDATGSGFHGDYGGGNADILLAWSARALWLALSEKARQGLRFASLPSEEAAVMVIHDRYLELRSTGTTVLPIVSTNGRKDPDVLTQEERRIYGELCDLAIASGELGDLVHPRVMELLVRWDNHYETLKPGDPA